MKPNSVITVMKNVPLYSDYQNTLYFADRGSQQAYFSSKAYKNFDNLSYQRVDNNTIRLNCKADTIAECNYMMFCNAGYTSRYYYAFINEVEYVNDNCCNVHYEIDSLQTWLLDCNIKECFVEREHSTTDKIGGNIVAEPIQIGEMVTSDYKELTNMNSYLVIIAICDVENATVDGTLYDGIYGGCTLYAYQSTDVQSINSKIDEYLDKPDAINSIYICPSILIPGVDVGGKRLESTACASGLTVKCDAISTDATFCGYKPKNNKLYTYPFNTFCIDNASGNSLQLRYEFFDGNAPVIKIMGTITSPVRCVARPCNYKNIKGYDSLSGYTTLNTESITLESYPHCSWNTDSYQAWISQNAVPMLMGGATSVGNSLITAPLSANPEASIGIGALNSVVGTLSTMYRESIKADICKGTLNNGNINCTNGTQQFYTCRCHVTREYAEIIDDFFTMFGYAVNKVKKPNYSSRPSFNYIKTKNFICTGNVPNKNRVEITNIFNNGITFWKSKDVGNYNLGNEVD